jgi:plastocyanin
VNYISYALTAIASTCLVILLSLSACSPKAKQSQPVAIAQAGEAQVKIRNFKFEPANLTIALGKTVQFTNVDEEPHTATATDGAFDSKALDTDQTWRYRAMKPGVFPYICSVHPFMKGTVTVNPENP